MKAKAVLNRQSGTLKSVDLDSFCIYLKSAFAHRGISVECRAVGGRGLIPALREAVETEDTDILIAGGGDGTISAAASIVQEAGKPLGIIPAGTMNMFARSLGIPLDIHAAADALAGGSIRRCDFATANGRMFLYQYAVGLHPKMVRLRNEQEFRSRLGKILASASALLQSLGQPPLFDVELKVDGAPSKRRVSSIAVSNNRFGEGHFPYADHVDGGELGLYVVGAISDRSSARLITDLILGTWRSNDDVQEFGAKKISLEFLNLPRRARASIDGELIGLEEKVSLEIHPGGLQVLAPATDTAK